MESISSDHAKLLFGPKALRKQVHVTKVRQTTSPETNPRVSPLSPKHVDIIRTSNQPGLTKTTVPQLIYKRSVAKDTHRNETKADSLTPVKAKDNKTANEEKIDNGNGDSEQLKTETCAEKEPQLNDVLHSMLFAKPVNTKKSSKKNSLHPSQLTSVTSKDSSDINTETVKSENMNTLAKSNMGQGIHKRKENNTDLSSLLGLDPNGQRKQDESSARVDSKGRDSHRSGNSSTDRLADSQAVVKRPPDSPGLRRKLCNPDAMTGVEHATSGLDWIKFRPTAVKEVLHQILVEYLQGRSYDSEACTEWTKEISDQIKLKLKNLNYDRYKFIVQVVIGEQRGYGVKMGCRCFWDSDTDNYAQDIFMNESLFCVAAAFGVFYY